MDRKAAVVDIAGVGKRTAKALAEHGLHSVHAVAEAPLDRLDEILGIGAEKAAAFKEAATRLLVSEALAVEEAKRQEDPDRTARKHGKKKRKKEKSDKKNKKGKNKKAKS